MRPRKRPKKGSNEEWVHPKDPEAQIMKMKSGGTAELPATPSTKTIEETLTTTDARPASTQAPRAMVQIVQRSV